MNSRNMKQLLTRTSLLLFAGTVLLSLQACKEKKADDVIITSLPMEEVKKPLETQRVGDYDQTTPVEWGGATYQVAVSRIADESLPVVEDGQGVSYYDNRINVRVVRSDGSEFFARSFTKGDFVEEVPQAFRKNSVLLGIVFDHAEGNHLIFAASVGSPDKTSDEYVPLVMKLSKQGGVSISRDTQLDTEGIDAPETVGNVENEEEDGV